MFRTILRRNIKETLFCFVKQKKNSALSGDTYCLRFIFSSTLIKPSDFFTLQTKINTEQKNAAVQETSSIYIRTQQVPLQWHPQGLEKIIVQQ